MSSNRFNELAKASEKQRDILTKQMKKKINKLYSNLYKDLSKKIENMPSTVEQFYLEQLQKELGEEIRKLNKEIFNETRKAMKKASELGTDAQLNFFSELSEQYGLGIEKSIFKMCTKIHTDVIAEVLHGKIYKDRLGISERIWADTKRFDKDIETIITEGIAQKKGTYEIAKDLEKYLNPKYKEAVYDGVRGQANFHAYKLAHTSIIHTYQQVAKRSSQKNPYIEGIQWVSSHDSRCCQICQERDGKLYKPKDLPIDHPMGRCTFLYDIPMSLEDIGEELGAWVNGVKNEKLNKWFSEYGLDFI